MSAIAPGRAETLLTPDTYQVLTHIPHAWTDEARLRVVLGQLLKKKAHSTAARLALLEQKQLIERRWPGDPSKGGREIRRIEARR